MKFRKRPVVIDAVQWTGENWVECFHFLGGARIQTDNPHSTDIMIRTLEGQHIASLNDWLIKGVKGEFYPCKPDIFEMTYEAVDD